MKYMTYYSISKFQNIEEGRQYEKLIEFLWRIHQRITEKVCYE